MSSLDTYKKRFELIYEKESDALFRFCLLRVSDRERAMDITQETFKRLWISISSGKRIENPRALIFLIARNLIIDWYRRVKSISLEGLSGGDDEREFDAPDPNATVEIELSVDAGRALAMIEALEPQYQEVIYFRYIEDLPPKEIAEILKLNANTVSVRLTRGIDELRRLMGIPKKHE